MRFQNIISWFSQPNYYQTIIFGSCLGVGFIFPALWWLALPSIVWMLHALESSVATKKLVILFTLIWGIKALSSIIWFWSAYPINWVDGLSMGAQLALISVYWLTSGLWLSSGGALLAFLSRFILKQTFIPNILVLVLFPVMWSLSEILAAGVFSIFTAGPGSFIQAYFSFGMVGYLLATTSFGVWIAAIGQVYGLSIALVGISVLLYVIKKHISRRVFVWCIVTVSVIISWVPFLQPGPPNNTQTVIAIDTRFDSELLTSDAGYIVKADTLKTAVSAALKYPTQAIILPEDSRYVYSNFPNYSTSQLMAYWQFVNPDSTAVLIDSGRYTTEAGETVLRASAFDVKNGLLWQFDKQYLVPQGEYVPSMYGTVLRLLGYGTMIDAVATDSSYIPGPLTQTAQLPDYVPGVLFCFESVNPRGVRTLATTRPLSFVAHPISHAWFHEPQILWQQLDIMLQVQARYSGVPIVSAGNMATGKLYLPSGEIQTGEVIESGERFTLKRFVF